MDIKRYTVFFGFWKFFPLRLKRILVHAFPQKYNIHKPKNYSILLWTTELIVLLFDLFGLPEFILQFRLIINRDLRKLNPREKGLIERFYGPVSFIDQVWMNPRDPFYFRKWAYAYVFNNSINYHRSIPDAILIHEFMHVIQYHLVGSVYIIRALVAQKSSLGYHYGNANSLYNDMITGKNMWDFNYEQQAQIMQDYFELCKTEDNTPSIINSGFRAMLWNVKDEVVKL